MENPDAEKCLEIIGRRLPLTPEETRLIQLIVNDIRLEFDLDGAVHPSNLDGTRGKPPKEWLW